MFLFQNRTHTYSPGDGNTAHERDVKKMALFSQPSKICNITQMLCGAAASAGQKVLNLTIPEAAAQIQAALQRSVL